MPIYDDKLIGKLLAWVGDHSVYEYGNDRVIKFSKFDYFIGVQEARRKYVSDYEICRKHFGDYILETDVMASADGSRVAKIQPKISGRFLTKRSLTSEGVKTQLRQFLARYDEFAGPAFFDLVGHQGIVRPCLSNIYITPGGVLKVFDATLFDIRELPVLLRLVFYPLLPVARLLQHVRLSGLKKSLT